MKEGYKKDGKRTVYTLFHRGCIWREGYKKTIYTLFHRGERVSSLQYLILQFTFTRTSSAEVNKTYSSMFYITTTILDLILYSFQQVHSGTPSMEATR